MDLKTAYKKQAVLEKLEQEGETNKEKLVEKLLQALSTAHTETDKKLEELAKCCCEEENVR